MKLPKYCDQENTMALQILCVGSNILIRQPGSP